jgi:hypothetical protein
MDNRHYPVTELLAPRKQVAGTRISFTPLHLSASASLRREVETLDVKRLAGQRAFDVSKAEVLQRFRTR